MASESYELKLKKKVQIDESTVRKVIFETKSGTRYGLKAKTIDGRTVTKFLSKDDWDNLKVGDEADTNETLNPDEGTNSRDNQ